MAYKHNLCGTIIRKSKMMNDQWWFNCKMKIKWLRNDSVKLVQLDKCSYVEWCSEKVRE